MRTTGTVKWFNDAKSFGFTSCRAQRARRPRTS